MRGCAVWSAANEPSKALVLVPESQLCCSSLRRGPPHPSSRYLGSDQLLGHFGQGRAIPHLLGTRS